MLKSIESGKKNKERQRETERERERQRVIRPQEALFQYIQKASRTPSESPNNSWGANWPGVLTDPSCAGEEEEETARATICGT